MLLFLFRIAPFYLVFVYLPEALIWHSKDNKRILFNKIIHALLRGIVKSCKMNKNNVLYFWLSVTGKETFNEKLWLFFLFFPVQFLVQELGYFKILTLTIFMIKHKFFFTYRVWCMQLTLGCKYGQIEMIQQLKKTKHTECPGRDETSETTERNVHCLFPYSKIIPI